MIAIMKPTERLYLTKRKDEEIYLDICNLPQHQIDGIRFIYKQFRKKNQGVILNDPPGYGKVIQAVLFLEATRNFHTQSVLILCSEAKVNSWVQNFQKWTSVDDKEIIIESYNPNKKNMLICINPMKNIAQFAKRTWSVVILDDNTDITKDVIKIIFKANFKIWITSQDMKDNLTLFSQIYNWLKPDRGFDINDFTTNNSSLQDVISKSILLDAFMQNIVIRRTNCATALNKEDTTNVFQSKLSRKNKDITGTKVKRSKKTDYKDDAIHSHSAQTALIGRNVLGEENNKHHVAKMDIEMNMSQAKQIDLQADYITEQEDKETSKTQNDTSIENDIETALDSDMTEFDSSEKSSICIEVNNSSDIILKDTKKEDNNADRVCSVIKSSEDNKINLIDIKSNNTTDEEKNNVYPGEGGGIKSDSKKPKTIDEIMIEMEEKTLKKFKGSLLDRIF